jgi:Zn-dependent M28 family amino/carboxypeptidase
MGYTPQEQPFTYSEEGGGKGINVIAVKKGASERQIIVGAHYDSVADGGSKGADDNASGVAVMMEAAERVKSLDIPYTIVFIAFGAEEVDILGSDYYVSQMSRKEKDNTVVMVNLDSLAAGNKTYVYGSRGKAGKVRDWALQQAKTLKLNLLDQPGFNPEDAADDSDDYSDHAPFRKAGIQFVYFEATDWTLGDEDGWTQVDPKYGEDGEIWHTKFDNIPYLEKTFPGRIDAHLKLFSTILFEILTRYQE